MGLLCLFSDGTMAWLLWELYRTCHGHMSYGGKTKWICDGIWKDRYTIIGIDMYVYIYICVYIYIYIYAYEIRHYMGTNCGIPHWMLFTPYIVIRVVETKTSNMEEMRRWCPWTICFACLWGSVTGVDSHLKSYYNC